MTGIRERKLPPAFLRATSIPRPRRATDAHTPWLIRSFETRWDSPPSLVNLSPVGESSQIKADIFHLTLFTPGVELSQSPNPAPA